MVSWEALIELKEKEELLFILKSFKYKEALIIPIIHPFGIANLVKSKNKELHLKSIEILKNSLKYN